MMINNKDFNSGMQMGRCLSDNPYHPRSLFMWFELVDLNANFEEQFLIVRKLIQNCKFLIMQMGRCLSDNLYFSQNCKLKILFSTLLIVY
uniref:Uncharacterized protein n=1 Tax=Kalanchoe fedtschenkoi TaxID=63787 RepID=A0A7N0ZSI8_KALFE